MCKFIGKSNEWVFCKLSKSEILRFYSIVHVAMETTKMSNFTCQSKSFISIFFTCQVSACELQPFSCHDLAVCEYMSFAKSRQEKGCSSQAETWQVKNTLMKDFDWRVKCDVFLVSKATWTVEYNLKIPLCLVYKKIAH